jgi:hypothetical protein
MHLQNLNPLIPTGSEEIKLYFDKNVDFKKWSLRRSGWF